MEPPPAVVVDPPPAAAPQPAEIKEKKGIVVPFGSQTKNTPMTSKSQPPDPNILWGATASAAIAAFAAQIAERKRQEEEARKRAASAKAQRYKAIARAYQASLNAFKDGLVKSGVKVVDAIKQRTKALQNGKIPSSVAAIVSNYKTAQEERKTRRARIVTPDEPPPPSRDGPYGTYDEAKRAWEAEQDVVTERKTRIRKNTNTGCEWYDVSCHWRNTLSYFNNMFLPEGVAEREFMDTKIYGMESTSGPYTYTFRGNEEIKDIGEPPIGKFEDHGDTPWYSSPPGTPQLPRFTVNLPLSISSQPVTSVKLVSDIDAKGKVVSVTKTPEKTRMKIDIKWKDKTIIKFTNPLWNIGW